MSYLYAGLHINTTEPVYHMEIDKYLIGRNFLISSTNQLQTANRKETVTLLSDVRIIEYFYLCASKVLLICFMLLIVATPVLKRLEFNAIYQAPCSYLQEEVLKIIY
ncbi:hypothetical protein EB796_019851 [Bugula neritina]|uniref:Uncharacterized protein n=1 Tax=Bugula neritina TaxID=10212 RepID=A0A7J7J8D0_BUGNE|nr:hypothetical protein EB796_019851 [Bugula neritina]